MKHIIKMYGGTCFDVIFHLNGQQPKRFVCMYNNYIENIKSYLMQVALRIKIFSIIYMYKYAKQYVLYVLVKCMLAPFFCLFLWMCMAGYCLDLSGVYQYMHVSIIICSRR